MLTGLDKSRTKDYTFAMPERDENEQAVHNVDKLTDSEPVNGEDLVKSDALKRQFREAKERLSKPSGEKSV